MKENYISSFNKLFFTNNNKKKNSPVMWETWVWFFCWEAPLEKGKATHSSILAWRVPGAWTWNGLEWVEQDWETFTLISI